MLGLAMLAPGRSRGGSIALLPALIEWEAAPDGSGMSLLSSIEEKTLTSSSPFKIPFKEERCSAEPA